MEQENQLAIRQTHCVALANNPKDYFKNLPTKTAAEAIFNDVPSLSVIKKDVGENGCLALLNIILTEFVLYFNVGKSMTPAQIEQTSDLVLKKYWYLKPSEFKYCFENAKMGKYTEPGKPVLFDRIDGSIIFEFIDKFIVDRDNEFVKFREKENQQHKQELVIHPDIQAKLKPFFEGKEVDKSFVKPAPRELTPAEQLIQDILKEFDSLFANRPINSEAKWRTVTHIVDGEEKELTVEQFVEIRLQEYNKL